VKENLVHEYDEPHLVKTEHIRAEGGGSRLAGCVVLSQFVGKRHVRSKQWY